MVLNDTLERLGLADDARHWVDLATREAVANAIKHGNRGAADKHVEIEMAVAGEEVVLRIGDQGGGFDPRGVGDPLSPENLLRPSGRGLFYMQSFMDEVTYEGRPGGGTLVTLHKRVFGSKQDSGAGSAKTAQDETSGGD